MNFGLFPFGWLHDRKKDQLQRPAFLVHTAEIANHFSPIWQAFGDHPCDILLLDDVILPPWTTLPRNGRVRPVAEVLGRKERYATLVTNHVISLAPVSGKKPLIKALSSTNIRMMYAAGKSAWNLDSWNSLYDGVLCFGPHHAKLFAEQFGLPVVEMGYPRFDRFFREFPDIQVLQAQYGCDPDKPTIVWLPTWKNLSSVDHFNAEIAALLPSYNVVAKVHPLMPDTEPERVERLTHLGLNALLTGSEDNLPLYQLADFMLFDYGGPPFAAIYTAKRFLLLNVLGAESDALTGPLSPDIQLRAHFANVDPGSNQLAKLLEDPNVWLAHEAASDLLRSAYFAPNYGNSAEIAAAAIVDRTWITRARVRS